MKKKIILILIIAVFGLIVPVSATWIILTERQLTPAYNPTSGLTEYLAQQSADSATANLYIYDNGATANSYTAITSDVTYSTTNKTVNLGYTDRTLTLNDNVSFPHTDAKNSYTSFTAPSSAKSAEVNTNYGNIKYIIKLTGDITIASGKYLSFGAEVCSSGSGQGKSGGVIVSESVALDLNGHILTVESGAILYAYGYIFDGTAGGPSGDILQGTRTYDYGKGKIINRGTIYSPYVVENYSGGGKTSATGAAQTVPFTLYSIPYLSCVTEFYYGSSLLCPTALYAADTYHTTTVNFIGSSNSALIQLQSGAFVIRKGYNPRTTSTQTFCQQYRAQYEINGKININTLSLSISFLGIDVTVNLAEYHFPIPPYADIILNQTAEVTLPLQLDFFPGSTLYCAVGSNLSLSSMSGDSIRIAKKTSMFGSAKNKTFYSYGSVNMVSQMTPDNSTCYAGLNYTLSNYNQYEQAEAALYNPAGSAKARATINGNITTDSQAGHVLSGKINLNETTLNSIKNNLNFISLMNKSYQEYHEVNSATLVLDYGKPQSYLAGADFDYTGKGTIGGYHILPLVSNGRVVGDIVNNNFSAITGDNVTYDFNEGVYTNVSDGTKYAYIPDTQPGYSINVNGSVKAISNHDATNHTVTIDSTTYRFYRNYFTTNTNLTWNNTLKYYRKT